MSDEPNDVSPAQAGPADPTNHQRRGMMLAAWFGVGLLALPGCGGGGAAAPAPDPGPGAPVPAPAPPAPQITGFTPSAEAPGAEVFITGLNFATTVSGNSVSFNGVSAVVLSASAELIVAVVPNGATEGQINVTTGGGTALSDIQFSVLLASNFTTRLLAPGSDGGLAWNGNRLVGAGASISTATDAAPQVWNQRASGADLNDVAWNGTSFLALGAANVIRTSDDGLTWTPQAAPNTPGQLHAVAGNVAMWVAVGDAGSIVSSPDALTWTPQISNTTSALRHVAWAGSVFVAVGDSGSVVSSPDGLSWTLQNAGVGSDAFTALGSDGTTFIACTTGAQPKLLGSVDGVMWTLRASNLGEFAAVAGVSSTGPWVAVGPSGTVYSGDGLTWGNSFNLPGGLPRRVLHTGSQFIALGLTTAGHAAVWTSPDGLAWSVRGVNFDWRALARSAAGQIVALPSGDRTATSSDAGVTWTFGAALPNAADAFIDLAWYAERSQFLAVVQEGPDRYLHASSDGLSWTRGAVLPVHSVFGASPSLLVVAGSGVATSVDGVTWTPRTPLTLNGVLFDLRWLGSLFVGVGANGTIVTSSDGLNWTARTSGSTASLRGAAASPAGVLVVVGDTGTVLRSTNSAVTWTTRASSTFSGLGAVTWAGSEFVAVGSAGMVIRSPDGITWTRQLTPYTSAPTGPNPLHLHDALWLGDRLLICGARGLLVSSP